MGSIKILIFTGGKKKHEKVKKCDHYKHREYGQYFVKTKWSVTFKYCVKIKLNNSDQGHTASKTAAAAIAI